MCRRMRSRGLWRWCREFFITAPTDASGLPSMWLERTEADR
jgi:hypothetical protein